MYDRLFSKRINDLCRSHGIQMEKLESGDIPGTSAIRELLSRKQEDPDIQLLHRSAIFFHLTLAEFLDFTELNDYIPD